MQKLRSQKVESDLNEIGIFMFLTLVIFFVAIGMPTLINTTPSIGYEGIDFTPVTTMYQEAYAYQDKINILTSYYFNPILTPALLVMPTTLDNLPPPDPEMYFDLKYSQAVVVEEGFVMTDRPEMMLVKDHILLLQDGSYVPLAWQEYYYFVEKPVFEETVEENLFLPPAYADSIFVTPSAQIKIRNDISATGLVCQSNALPDGGTSTSSGADVFHTSNSVSGLCGFTVYTFNPKIPSDLVAGTVVALQFGGKISVLDSNYDCGVARLDGVPDFQSLGLGGMSASEVWKNGTQKISWTSNFNSSICRSGVGIVGQDRQLPAISARVDDFINRFTTNTHLDGTPVCDSVDETKCFYSVAFIDNNIPSNRQGSSKDASIVGEYFRVQLNPVQNATDGHWQMKEHSFYPSGKMDDCGFTKVGSLFTIDSGSTDAEQGQCIIFKTFNKTAVGTPDVRVFVNASGTGSSEMRVFVDVMDGAMNMGVRYGTDASGGVVTESLTDIIENKLRKDLGTGQNHRLGIVEVDLPFEGEIQVKPEYSAGSENEFTVFVGLKDNSTDGTITLDINNVKVGTNFYDFLSPVVRFHETGTLTVSPIKAELDTGYLSGNATQITNSSSWQFTGYAPTGFFDPTFDLNEAGSGGQFGTVPSDTVEIDIGGSSGDAGHALFFKVFRQSDYFGQNFTIFWNATNTGATGEADAHFRLLDGSYDRKSIDDFPQAQDLPLKGGGVLGTTGQLQMGSGLTSTITSHEFEPDWGSSTLSLVTLNVLVEDEVGTQHGTLHIQNITASGGDIWNFNTGDVYEFEGDPCTGRGSVGECGILRIDGVSDFPNLEEATPLPTPNSITGGTVTPATSLDIDWVHDGINTTGYRIYRTSTEVPDTKVIYDTLGTEEPTIHEKLNAVKVAVAHSGISVVADEIISELVILLKNDTGMPVTSDGLIRGAIFADATTSTTSNATLALSVFPNGSSIVQTVNLPSGLTPFTFEFRRDGLVNLTSGFPTDIGFGVFRNTTFTGDVSVGQCIDLMTSCVGAGSGRNYDTSVGGGTWIEPAPAFDIPIRLTAINQTKLSSLAVPLINDTGSLDTNFTDTTTLLGSGHTYFYRVVPLNGDIEGDTIVILNGTEGYIINQTLSDFSVAVDFVANNGTAPIFNVTITDTVTAKDGEDSIVNLLALTYIDQDQLIFFDTGLGTNHTRFDGYVGNVYQSSPFGLHPQNQPIKIKEVYVNFAFGSPVNASQVATTGNMTAVILQNVTIGGSTLQSDVVTIAESDVFDLTVEHTYPIRPTPHQLGESVVFNFTGTDLTFTNGTFIGFRIQDLFMPDQPLDNTIRFEGYTFAQGDGQGTCTIVNSTDTFGACPIPLTNQAIALEIGILVEDTPTFTTTGGIEPDKLIVHHTFDSETLFDSAYPDTLFKNAGTLQELADISVLNQNAVQTNTTSVSITGLLGEGGFVGSSGGGDGLYEIGFSDAERTGNFNFLSNNETSDNVYSINLWVNGTWSNMNDDFTPILTNTNQQEEQGIVLGVLLTGALTYSLISKNIEVLFDEQTSATLTDDTWGMVSIIVDKTNSTDTVQLCIDTVCQSIAKSFSDFRNQTGIDNKMMLGDFVITNFDWYGITVSDPTIPFLVDELCIWKDHKLTPANLATLYNSGSGATCGTVNESSGGVTTTFIPPAPINITITDTVSAKDREDSIVNFMSLTNEDDVRITIISVAVNETATFDGYIGNFYNASQTLPPNQPIKIEEVYVNFNFGSGQDSSIVATTGNMTAVILQNVTIGASQSDIITIAESDVFDLTVEHTYPIRIGTLALQESVVFNFTETELTITDGTFIGFRLQDVLLNNTAGGFEGISFEQWTFDEQRGGAPMPSGNGEGFCVISNTTDTFSICPVNIKPDGLPLALEVGILVEDTPTFTTTGGIEPDKLVVYHNFDSETLLDSAYPNTLFKNAGTLQELGDISVLNNQAVQTNITIVATTGIIGEGAYVGGTDNTSTDGDGMLEVGFSDVNRAGSFNFFTNNRTLTDTYSVNLWVKGTWSDVADDFTNLLHNNNQDGVDGFHLSVGVGGEIYYFLKAGDQEISGAQITTATLTDDTFGMVSIIVEKSNATQAFQICVDTVCQSFDKFVDFPDQTVINNKLMIGDFMDRNFEWADNTNSEPALAFTIDELCIWQEHKLTPAQLTTLFNSGSGTTCSNVSESSGGLNVTFTAGVQAPDQVTGLVITQEMNNNATLDWDDATGADNYQVLRKDNFTAGTENANGTWQYREQLRGVASTAQCQFIINADNVQLTSAGASTGLNDCYMFKTFPREFMNNTIVQFRYDLTNTIGSNSGRGFFTTTNIDNAYNRNNETQFPAPLSGSKDWTGGNEVISLLDLEILSLNGGEQTETMNEPDWGIGNTPDTDFVNVIMEIEDINSLAQNLKLKIFWVNITDVTTGDPKAFYNFTGSSKTSDPEDPACGNDCERGTFEAGFFNSTENFVVVGTPVTSDFEDSTIPLQNPVVYKVRGNNTSGFGLNSTEVDFGLIQQIINLNVTTLNSTAIKLTWNQVETIHPSDTLTGVIIQRGLGNATIPYESNTFNQQVAIIVASNANPAYGQAITVNSSFTVRSMFIDFALGSGNATDNVDSGTGQMFVYKDNGSTGVYAQNSTDLKDLRAIVNGGDCVSTNLFGNCQNDLLDNTFNFDPDEITHPAGDYIFGIRFVNLDLDTGDGLKSINQGSSFQASFPLTGGEKFVTNWLTSPNAFATQGISTVQDTNVRVIGGNFTLIATVDDLDTMFTDNGLVENTTYTYRLKGQSAVSTGTFSAESSNTTESGGQIFDQTEIDIVTVSDQVTTTFIPAPPLPPTNVSSAQNGTDITINWTKEATADGYKILRKATNDTTSKVKGEDLPNDYLKLDDKPVGDVEIGGNRNQGSVTFNDFICGGAQPCGRAQNFTMGNQDFTLDKIRLKIVGTSWSSGTSVLKVAVFNGSSASLNEILENSTDIFTSTVGSNPFPSGSFHEFEFDDFVLLANQTYMVGAYTNGSIGGSIQMFRDDTGFGFTSYATNFDNGALVVENTGDLSAWGSISTLNLQIDLIGDQFEEIATLGDVDTFTDVLSSEDEGNLFFYKIKSLIGSIEGNSSSIVNQTAPLISGSDLFNSTSKIWQFREHDLQLSVLEGASGAGCLTNCGSGGKFPNANVSIGAQEGRTTATNGQALPTDLLNLNTGLSATGGDSQSNDRGAGIIHFFKIFNTTEITDSSVTIAWQQEANGGAGDAGLLSVATLRVFDGIINKDSGFNFAHDIPVLSNVDGVRTSLSGLTLSGIEGASVGAGIGDFNMTIQTLNASSINWGSFNSSFATVVVSMRDNDSTPSGSNSGAYELFIANITVSKIGTWNFTNPQIIYTVDGNRQGSSDVCPKTCMDLQKGFIGERGFVNTTSFAVPAVPDQVTGLTVVQNMNNNATLDWDDASGADNYQVFRTNATGFEIQEWELKEQDRFEGGFCFSEPSYIVEYQSGVISSAGLFIINNSLAVAQGNADTAEDLLKLQHAHPDAVCPQGTADPSRGDFYLFKVFDKADLPQTGNITVIWGGYDNYFVCETAFPLACANGFSTRSLTLQVRDGVLDRFNSTDFPANPATPTGTGAGVPLKGAGILTSLTGGQFGRFTTGTFGAFIHANTTSYDLSSSTLDNVTLNIFIDDGQATESPTTLLQSIEIEDFGIWDFQRKSGTDKLGNGIINYTADLQQNGLDGMDDGSMIAQFTCTKTVGTCDFGAPVSLQGTGQINATLIGSPVLSEFTDSTISPLTNVLNYTVRGNNTAGFGANSTAVEFGLIQPITGLNATALNSTAIKLSWDLAQTVHPNDPLTGVIIQRATTVGIWNLTSGNDQDPTNHTSTYDIGAGIYISPDGTEMFVPDVIADTVNKFSLTTPFEVSTAVSTQNSTDLSSTLGSKVTQITDVHFKVDGTKMFILDSGSTDIYEYTLSTPFDLSTLAFNAEFTTLTTDLQGIWITEDGSRMYAPKSSSDRLFQFDITTAWDITTLSSVTDVPYLPSTGVFDVAVRSDGEFLGLLDIGGGLNDSVDGYNMTTAFDITTLVSVGGINVGQGGLFAPEPRSLWIPQSGSAVYVDDVVKDLIFQFDMDTSINVISDFINVTTVDDLDTMFTDNGLVENTTYIYRLKGQSAVSTGSFGENSSATTQSAVTPDLNQTEIDTITVSDQTDVTTIFEQTEIDTVTVVDDTQLTPSKSNSDTASTNDQTVLISPPFPITTLVASTVGNTCELSWSSPPNGGSVITKFQIFRSVSSGAFTLLLNQTFVNHTDLGLANNVLYEYNVTSINAFGDSEPSNIEDCMPIVSGVPNAPSLIDVNEEPNGDVTIDWIASTEGSPTGYKIERKVGGGGFLVLVANTGTSDVTFTDTTTTPATKFTYRISGINAFGTGVPSNEGSITTASPPVAPLLSGVQNGDQIDLSWTVPLSDNPINGYKIDRRINLGALTTLVANTTTTLTTFTDTNVTKPDTFGYRVRALSSAGEGTVSNIVDITFGSHLIVKVREQDGSFFKGGGIVKGVNSTFSLLVGLDVNSDAIFDNLAIGNYNFTFIDDDSFILNKTFNIPAPAGNDTSEFTINALVFDVDCPVNGFGTDIRIKVNYTDDKDITEFPSTPVCDSTEQVSWSTRWQGNAVNDTSTMIADFISTIFRANAEQFLASADEIPTIFNSGENQIESDEYIVNMTDVTINFNLFLGRAPSGGGGSGSGSDPTPQVSIPDPEIVFADRLTGLSLLSRTHQFAQAGDVIEGSITVNWEGEDNLIVREIQAGDFMDIRFDELTPFPLDQRIEGIGEFAKSSAEIRYTIILPPNECNVEIGLTQNCFDPILHTIPIEMEFGLGDQIYEASTEVFVDGRPIPIDIVQLQVILLFIVLIASAVFGNFIRRRFQKGRGRQRVAKKKFKKKFDSS